MGISSPAFADGEDIPQKYTCDGEDLSPPLKISNVPPEAESLAIIVDDLDAPGGVFVHWIVWNVPPETREVPENIPSGASLDLLNGAIQGKNGFGELGYRGPCPPPGPSHKYRFKLYALDRPTDLNPGVLKADLEREIENHVIKEDTLTGKYGR